METAQRILLSVVSASVFSACDFLSARWAKQGFDPRAWELWLFIATAPVGYFLFAWLNARTSLAESGGVVNVLIAVETVLLGLLYYGDRLSTAQWCGIALGFVSLALIFLGGGRPAPT